jgi:lipopolysaccharide transport system permease protein
MNSTTGENARTLGQVGPAAEATAAGAGPSRRALAALPDKPLVTIQAGRAWAAVNLREVWAYRELLYFLVWRDVKVRYKQTFLGVAWVMMQPLMTTLVFTLFFGVLAGIGEKVDVPYPVFAFAGLLPWNFFATTVNNGSNSLVGNSNLVTKVYFPRVLIPCATVGAGLVDFAIAFLVLLGLMAYYGVAPTPSLLMLPPLVVLLTLFALGVGMWLSALNVKYRDVRHVLPFLLQMWMFASPVIYPPTFVPQRWRWLLVLNPMTGIVDGFRAAALGGRAFDWTGLAVSAAVALALLAYASWAFSRMEKNFADIV